MPALGALFALAILALTAPVVVDADTFTLSDTYQGSGFLSGFTHEAISDPTHGRVNYVSQSTALSKNLTYAHGDTLIIRADDTATLSASGPGRDSVRLQSNKQYTNHVSIWNIRHMPQGCGTWPAVWEVGADWPNNGEIDIVEGVNDQSPNQASFHTSSGCTMPASRAQTGTETGGNNCDVAATDNTGCGVKDTRSGSYGPAFNAGGGGFYAMQRTAAGIKIWFWPRGASGIPEDVASAEGRVDTDAWGTPMAYYPSTDCDFSTHLGPHNIIINLTFCGDWAGADSVYAASGCPSTCEAYVNEHPQAFSDAYFDVAYLKVYE